MNPVLSEIIKTGVTKTADGSGTVKLHSEVPREEGELLQRIVRRLDPTVSLEIGLAYGLSALFICDALNIRKGTQHIVIDPNQLTAWDGSELSLTWQGIGIANVQRAGFGDIVRLIEAPSFRALPQLEQAGQRIDFAFIDGWHTFDFALVDFFYIDRMLNVGGVVAFDDSSWPSIRKVCRFVRTNLSYSVFDIIKPDREPSLKRRLISEGLLANSPFRRLLKPDIVAPDRKLGLGSRCIAFRKEADDSRRWDHFVDF